MEILFPMEILFIRMPLKLQSYSSNMAYHFGPRGTRTKSSKYEKEIYILSAFSATSADLFHKIGKKNTWITIYKKLKIKGL